MKKSIAGMTIAGIVGLGGFIAACGATASDGTLGSLRDEDANTAYLIQDAARKCLSQEHGGPIGAIVIGNGHHGVTSAAGALCKDGTAIVFDN